MSSLSTIEALKTARELISQGWTQGQYVRRDAITPAYCVIGPLGPAIGGFPGDGANPYAPDSGKPIRAYLRAHGLELCNVKSLYIWNDHPDRTKEDVLDLYDRAIALCETESDPLWTASLQLALGKEVPQ